MKVFTFLGSTAFLVPFYVLLIAYYFLKKNYLFGIYILIITASSTVLFVGLKLIFHRQRPGHPVIKGVTGYSFPSGHAMASTVFYGFVMACVLTMKPSRHITVIAAGIVMIGLVCMSRVYLGVHYLSDVLAGILEAITWSTLVLTGLHIARAYRRSAESQRLPE